jgi:4-hydroxy-tetrahydrodipicolinate synthase
MTAMTWRGVMPAMTTCFREDLGIDFGFVARHAAWMVDAGCAGLVVCGSLGEAATLDFKEKAQIARTVVEAVGGRVPVVMGVSALATAEAVDLARAAEQAGCGGLMVLPPYVYVGDRREMLAHVAAVFQATPLSCMLYNNPIAYGTDFTPDQIAELTRHANFHAVKESSADVRRVTAIRALLGDKLAIFCGVDDLIVEALAAGAVGWIAGLVNAFPQESVRLFVAAGEGRRAEAEKLYRWFLPLLRLDVVPKFVQLIKFVQEKVGMGSARVRPPRLELTETEARETAALVEKALREKPG